MIWLTLLDEKNIFKLALSLLIVLTIFERYLSSMNLQHMRLKHLPACCKKWACHSPCVIMSKLLPFEIFFVQGQVLPRGRKWIFSGRKLPIVGQNGLAILLVSNNGAGIALPQDELSHRILKFFCSQVRCGLSHHFLLKKVLRKKGMPLNRKHLLLV